MKSSVEIIVSVIAELCGILIEKGILNNHSDIWRILKNVPFETYEFDPVMCKQIEELKKRVIENGGKL